MSDSIYQAYLDYEKRKKIKENHNISTNEKMCEFTLIDAKLLADSISCSLNILYKFCIMQSRNTLEEIEMTEGTIFTIKAAAERLSEIMDILAN